MKRLVTIAGVLVALCTSALGAGYYAWTWWQWPHETVTRGASHLLLTTNNGSHAVAMGEYEDDQDQLRIWTSTVAKKVGNGVDSILAYEWSDLGIHAGDWPDPLWWSYRPANPCVTANNNHKLWMTSMTTYQAGYQKCMGKTDWLSQQSPTDEYYFTKDGNGCNDSSFTGVCYGGVNDTRMVAAYTGNYINDNEVEMWALYSRMTTDVGENWWPDNGSDGMPILPDYPAANGKTTAPSLAVASRETAYVVYKKPNTDIVFERSMDWGYSWYNTPVTLGSGDQPCIAAVGSFVFVCWRDGNRIYYRYSRTGGDAWSDATSITGASAATLSHPNVSAITCGTQPGVLFACQWYYNGKWVDFSKFGHLVVEQPSHIAWQSNVSLSPIYTQDPGELRPSVATMYSNLKDAPIGANVYNVPPVGQTKRGIDLQYGQWMYHEFNPNGGGATGRLIARGLDGSMQYAAVIRPHVVSGPADSDLLPILVAPGSQPALALDGDGNRWVSYINADTIWTMTGDGSYRVAFAGSSSAVPGQPSIVCYSEQATSGYCAGVVFPVYDTAGGASRIIFARLDTSAVVLDTIESVANLRDSLPCLSLYKTDTLLCTFQHGDSVLAVMLADYGPATTGRPGAWSSPNLVTASGYHAMSTFEQGGGGVLNCVWTGKSGNDYAIHRATIDLSGGMFPSWTAQSNPSENAASEAGSPVYAGLGVTCWQEKVSGKWVIKGKVRGEEETFVANDTDAYHPHAVAESSAISPSIDQVRVHLLWTEGVTFEVDSGVYDTGETRYKCESLSVSRAGSDATKSNTGAKLLRKASGDSLFCVYSDLDGTVMYARSAAGDSWHRDVMVTSRDWPAIAEDSSGKRWVVVHKVNVGGTQTQEAYYRNGSSWTGPQTIYTSQPNGTVGPAGLSGSSYTTSGIAYAAFLLTPSIGPKSVVLAKFNGSVVATYTVASGMSLADPSLAVEPYKQDSDHVHVSWVDNGVVKYCMDTDGRSSSIASKWTSTVTLSNGQVTATHPRIAADRDQIVAAWAQGATTEIYSRKRSTGSAYNNWESEVNLSNTSTASDYPTIAMGDTVIVAWEEHRTVSDFDVLASINFGDTINIADNATKSGYPHVLFQNKTSGDTAIPYLHVIWSEVPEANVYEVAYNRHNLKQSGEGQQSAGQTPLPRKPMLAACRPNPFRDKTTIAYQLPQAGNVSLCVYDVTGRTVRTLASGFQKPGEYSVSWDSKDSRGQQVPRGVYFYRLDTPGFRDVKKAVVAR